MPLNDPPFKLSHSKLSLLDDCEKCFWFYGRDREKLEQIWARFPNAVDYKLKDLFDWNRRKNQMPEMLLLDERMEGLRLYDGPELKTWQNTYEGLRWVREDGHQLFGAVDDMLVRPATETTAEQLIVIDHKTTGTKWASGNDWETFDKEKAGFYRNQLSLYSLLLEKMGFEHPGYAFLHFIFADTFAKKTVGGQPKLLLKNRIVKVKVEPEKAEERFNRGIEILLKNNPPEKASKTCRTHSFIATIEALEESYRHKNTSGEQLELPFTEKD